MGKVGGGWGWRGMCACVCVCVGGGGGGLHMLVRKKQLTPNSNTNSITNIYKLKMALQTDTFSQAP